MKNNQSINQPTNNYKQTELGPLPQEWEVVRLGEVVKTKKGKKPKKLEEEWHQNYLPYLTAEYFRTGKPKQFVKVEQNSTFLLVNEDDVIFIWDGSNAGDTFTGLKGVLASTMVVIYPDEKLIKQFLYYFLKTKFELFNSKTTGSTIPHISKNLYENLPIPLPPLEEQKKIAYVLSVVQEAEEKTDKYLQALRELKKSTMKHLFTYGAVPFDEIDKVELKETEIGKIPKEWEVVRLGEVCNVVRGASPRPKGDPKFYGGNIPRLMVADVTRDYKYVTPRIDFLTEEGSKKSRKVKKGDLVIQVSGNPGTPCIVNVDCCIHDGFAYLSNLKKHIVETEYLFYILYFIKDKTKKLAFGSTFKNLQTYLIAKFIIPLPPLPEQQRIASILSGIDKQIEAVENKKKAIRELFNSLLKNLMTAKIRVNHLNLHYETTN